MPRTVYLFMVLMAGQFVFAQNFDKMQKVVSLDREATDFLGSYVAISGKFAAVTASGEDHDELGQNMLSNAGSVYIYTKDSNYTWVQSQKLVAPDRNVYGAFGRSVSIDGRTMAIGSPGSNSNELGDSILASAGAVYIYNLTEADTWAFHQKIVPSLRKTKMNFGYSIDLHNKELIAGAIGYDNDSIPIRNEGAAFIFEIDSSEVWNETQAIVWGNPSTANYFGNDVAIWDGVAIVGAKNATSRVKFKNYAKGGLVMVYRKSSDGWRYSKSIASENPKSNGRFGNSLAMYKNFFIVGSDLDNGGTFINGEVDFYKFNGSQAWWYGRKTFTSDYAGFSVDMGDSIAVVSAHNKSGSYSKAGGVYIYEFTKLSKWEELQTIVPSTAISFDYAGYSVAIDNGNVVFGAIYDDRDQNSKNAISNAGSVYFVGPCKVENTHAKASSCSSYTFKNQDLTQKGIYIDTLKSFNGCDSLIILDLDIQNSLGFINVRSCNLYESPSKKYIWKESGNYLDTITNNVGCDSIISVNLQIGKNSSKSELFKTSCNSYTLNGIEYSESGMHIQNLPNFVACDSTITLYLTINKVNTDVFREVDYLKCLALGASYRWLDCDSNFIEIEGDTNRVLFAPRSGSYAVEVIENGCTDTSDCQYLQTSNIEVKELNAFSVYPNPNKGNLKINIETKDIGSIVSIYNNLGKKIFSMPVLKTTSTINTQLPSGIYWVKLNSNIKTKVARVIVN